MARLVALFVPVALLAAGCSGDRSGGPRGTPAEVVGKAPGLTAAARTARVVIDGSNANATGVVAFATGAPRLDVSDGSTVVLTGDQTFRRPKGATTFTRV